jgi:hypothetical protein
MNIWVEGCAKVPGWGGGGGSEAMFVLNVVKKQKWHQSFEKIRDLLGASFGSWSPTKQFRLLISNKKQSGLADALSHMLAVLPLALSLMIHLQICSI